MLTKNLPNLSGYGVTEHYELCTWTLLVWCWLGEGSLIRDKLGIVGILLGNYELSTRLMSVFSFQEENWNLHLLQYSPKVLGHFALFVFCNELSSPSPPETLLVFWRSTCDNDILFLEFFESQPALFLKLLLFLA